MHTLHVTQICSLCLNCLTTRYARLQFIPSRIVHSKAPSSINVSQLAPRRIKPAKSDIASWYVYPNSQNDHQTLLHFTRYRSQSVSKAPDVNNFAFQPAHPEIQLPSNTSVSDDRFLDLGTDIWSHYRHSFRNRRARITHRLAQHTQHFSVHTSFEREVCPNPQVS